MIPGIGGCIGGLAGNFPVSISGTPVTTATEDSPYAGFTASASGGTPAYTYSLIGSWPAGISINSSSGAVSGTPSLQGTYPGLSVRVTDSLGATADLSTFTLTVAVSGETRQFMVPGAFVDSDGPRQSMPVGSFINEK